MHFVEVHKRDCLLVEEEGLVPDLVQNTEGLMMNFAAIECPELKLVALGTDCPQIQNFGWYWMKTRTLSHLWADS